jgi:tRNA A-37 threonylcarbamoyl transferase component Bud32
MALGDGPPMGPGVQGLGGDEAAAAPALRTRGEVEGRRFALRGMADGGDRLAVGDDEIEEALAALGMAEGGRPAHGRLEGLGERSGAVLEGVEEEGEEMGAVADARYGGVSGIGEGFEERAPDPALEIGDEPVMHEEDAAGLEGLGVGEAGGAGNGRAPDGGEEAAATDGTTEGAQVRIGPGRQRAPIDRRLVLEPPAGADSVGVHGAGQHLLGRPSLLLQGVGRVGEEPGEGQGRAEVGGEAAHGPKVSIRRGPKPRGPLESSDRAMPTDDHQQAFLATVPGFDRLDDAMLARVAALAEPAAFTDGDALMRRGETGDCMHVVVEGRVCIPLVDEDGGERLVTHLGPRDLVGEMALLTGASRSADAIAEGEVRTLVLHRAAVLGLVQASPELARFLADILGKRLQAQGGIQNVGKYRLVGELGAGSNGRVFRAVHPTLNRIVALKMLSHDLVHQPGFRERFITEARTLAGLAHENIVQIYDTEEAFGTVFTVMEAVEGIDLDRLLQKRGRLGVEEAGRILASIADALAYAHARGIAHRDVKPANVALEKSGRVKLMDFGLARVIREDPGTRAATIDGTPQYIAPETAVGKEGDGRVDVYALGVMAFEMVTGRLPFEADGVAEMLRAHVRTSPPDVRGLAEDLPPGLVTFIEGALIKDPERRLSDWAQIRRLLVPDRETDSGEERLVEWVLRIRCPSEESAEIERLIADLREKLGRRLAAGRLGEDP